MENILSYAQNQSSGTSFIELLFWVASVVGMWKMFEKAGRPGWGALLPFYNWYILGDISTGDKKYWVRLLLIFIPIVGWIAYIYFYYQMSKATAKAFGKPDGYAWGYTLLTPVFYCMTGFDDSSYYGPMGIGDARSGEAREAKTVNFDVVKDEEPVVQSQYTDYSDQVKVDEVKEETVDFTFDQPEE